ncbi:hypothetical protein MUK42_32811 [Musa troglodytarum]|uniref:Uncharacterized protein n=1 Tax=Musa troglodytarum TaxID=320322 RepID=A0A9E7I8J6_9LILI|nr:hypothetical protein MUK42_32811 [Musa troglodytarum]
MGHLTRDSILAAWLLLLLLLVVSCCHGPRDTQAFRGRALGRKSAPGFVIVGSSAKGMRPIPPSGPSKQHNSMGLQRDSSP